MQVDPEVKQADPAPTITWYRSDEQTAPPPYNLFVGQVGSGYTDDGALDRVDTGVHPRILEAGYRQDVGRLLVYAGQSLSFREERLLIDLTFDRLQDAYDQYQVLDQLAGNGCLTQSGRGYLWNCLPRLRDTDYRQRVAEALRWNYPC